MQQIAIANYCNNPDKKEKRVRMLLSHGYVLKKASLSASRAQVEDTISCPMMAYR
jgi:hypothetical protein